MRRRKKFERKAKLRFKWMKISIQMIFERNWLNEETFFSIFFDFFLYIYSDGIAHECVEPKLKMSFNPGYRFAFNQDRNLSSVPQLHLPQYGFGSIYWLAWVNADRERERKQEKKRKKSVRINLMLGNVKILYDEWNWLWFLVDLCVCFCSSFSSLIENHIHLRNWMRKYCSILHSVFVQRNFFFFLRLRFFLFCTSTLIIFNCSDSM